ncbi:MAG: hypothetical protein IT201_09460 [Thermoleophilia bacterium]|nr:hypothetical protein [Thermoleophilia bacterium]
MPASYLLPIAEREPLRWIVAEQRTVFAEHRAADAARLEIGDRLFLYTTRGCFHNPTRDRGRVIGEARVAAPVRRADPPPVFDGREYPHRVELEIASLAPLRQGVELAPLVPRLSRTFPDKATWSVRMRRALVPLDSRDAVLIARELSSVARPYAQARDTYA